MSAIGTTHFVLFLMRWRCELSGDIVDGGKWYERHAALGDLPHFTRIDDDQQQQEQQQEAAAATSSDDNQLDEAADGLEDIDIS